MTIRNAFFLCMLAVQFLRAESLTEPFKQSGYVEICDENNDTATFDALYAYFDKLIEFLRENPVWNQKLYCAKERFIRAKERNIYSTDFFGFYDESKGRSQISFYYSIHFHEFIALRYPELYQMPPITHFFEACFAIQQPYGNKFEEAARQLGLASIFPSKVPILFKVVKYFPSYIATKPHYDGTAFSLFLDSTDNESLLMCPYKSSFTVDDFSSPVRMFPRSSSILLIPGTLLAEFSLYPTPHIVAQSRKVRYATIAFAMRSNCMPQKIKFSPLPNFYIE